MVISRRNLVYTGLFGAAAVGLRSLATGLPRSMLLGKAVAQDTPPARMLILATSSAGDPLNGNVPGTYGAGLDQVVHPQDPAMAPTSMMLGDRSVVGAKPWADLGPDILRRTVFFHHGTYSNSHPAHPKVMRLMGNTRRQEMLVSIFSRELSAALETTQMEPISLGARGGELLSFEGRTLSNVGPTALKEVLGRPEGALADLMGLRDRDIDRVYALYKEHGTENQRRMIDRFARTRDEARSVSEELLSRLSMIEGNGAVDQVRAAPILAAMGISPVITIKIPFGGDNHSDAGLARETEQTVSGVAMIGELVRSLDALRAEGVLRSEVCVATLNVFGRTMSINRKGYNGRDHNSRHHCTVMIGDGFRGSVIGGITQAGNDWGAQAIDSATGRAAAGGDIPYEETFGSMAKTLGKALGLQQATLDEGITNGRVIDAALA